MRPRGLLPQLGTGAELVRARVVGVLILVGLVRAGDLARQPIRHRVVRIGMLGRDRRRAHHDLGAVRPQQRDLLGRDLVGHHEHAAIAPARRDDGETDAGVARRRLDDGAAGPSSPARSAASIIVSAGRSLTLPPGLRNSSLASRWQPRSRPTTSRRTSGVLPTRSSNDCAAAIGAPRSVMGTTSMPSRCTSSSVCNVTGNPARCSATASRSRVVAGADHAHLAGDAPAQLGDQRRRGLTGVDVGEVTGPCRESLRHFDSHRRRRARPQPERSGPPSPSANDEGPATMPPGPRQVMCSVVYFVINALS